MRDPSLKKRDVSTGKKRYSTHVDANNELNDDEPPELQGSDDEDEDDDSESDDEEASDDEDDHLFLRMSVCDFNLH